ncbi:MAG: hypothetical protein LC722_05665 [Actinobacteria bacterium]|nr:hypothetical protein [Actinomycetota bacterium]
MSDPKRSVKKPSFRERLRYRFDNALARGAWVIIGYLGIATLAIVALIAVFTVVARASGLGGVNERVGFVEAFWQMLLRSLDPGTFSSDVGWPIRILGLMVTLAGVIIAGSLIGLISSAVDQQIDALRRGRSNVLEDGHTLILGWSPRVPTIVSELVIANESEKNAAVVILADLDKTEMEEILRTSVENPKTTRLVTRRGDPGRMSDLELVGALRARSIIVTTSDEGDAGAIKATLAVLGLGVQDVPVIVEMTSASRARSLESITEGAVITVNADQIIAEVTAQAVHERGLAQVVREFLDFEGDELYLRSFPELAGATYAEAQQAFDEAAVMGVATAEGILLNPAPDRRLYKGDRILALVEDDAKFVFSGLRPVPVVTVGDEPDPEPPQRILMIGWSQLAPQAIRELDEFLAPGSNLTVVVDPELVDPKEAGQDLGLARISPGDADARTLLTLMALRKRWPREEIPPVRLVAEVLDQRNVPIAELAGVDDFIVSDQLASLMLAQLSERSELREVFDELFDAKGASISLRPASRFSPSGPVTFAEIVAAGNHFNESVLGYRTSAYGEVVLNPSKSQRVGLVPEDEVIVVTTR